MEQPAECKARGKEIVLKSEGQPDDLQEHDQVVMAYQHQNRNRHHPAREGVEVSNITGPLLWHDERCECACVNRVENKLLNKVIGTVEQEIVIV